MTALSEAEVLALAANPDRYTKEQSAQADDDILLGLDEFPDEAPDKPDDTLGDASDEGDEPDAAPHPKSLVGIAEAEAELFHAPDGTPYARLTVGTHRETWPLASRGFKEWLVRRYYEENATVPRAQPLADSMNVIAGRARYGGEAVPVHLRVAGSDDAIYLDLANDEWEVVEVTGEGWRVVSDPPVRFRRTKNSAPLPVPVAGGSLESLRELINVPSEDGWRLLVAWLVYTLSPAGPYPVLLLHGEQGSAKSTAERVLRSLVDPNLSPLRAVPKEEQDLLVACHNCWIVALDNLSGIQDWLSDALCRVASGTGLAKRELYTDSEEIVLNACRPVALNGITELATRGDLLDRSILVDLEPIPEDRRLPEKKLWRRFDELRPAILGALLDAASAALRNRSSVSLPRLPRMADFALFVTAAEEALGWEPGSFVASYEANRRDSNDISIDSSAIGSALRAVVANHGKWTGTAAELREELARWADAALVTSRYWPKNPWALMNQLDRLGPNLRAVGVGVYRPTTRTNRGRLISLWDVAEFGPNPPGSDGGDAGAEASDDPPPLQPALLPPEGGSE